METLLINIEKKNDFENNIILLLNEIKRDNQTMQKIFNIVNFKIQDKVNTLNSIGVKCYENQMYEYVIPFLQKAYEYDNNNNDVLVNLGMVLFEIKEYDLSFFYLNKINNKNEDILNLIDEIKTNYLEPKEKKDKKLKFLLRRIENNIYKDESLEKIIFQLKSDDLNIDEILENIYINIIKKEQLLNVLAISCFKSKLSEQAIFFLKKAYDIDQINKDTLYNLGYMFYEQGKVNLALEYVEKIENPDEMVCKLKLKIRQEVKKHEK